MLTVTQVGINCVEILVRHLSCTTKDGRGRVGMATRLAMIATLDHSWTNDHNSKLNTIGVVRKEKMFFLCTLTHIETPNTDAAPSINITRVRLRDR